MKRRVMVRVAQFLTSNIKTSVTVLDGSCEKSCMSKNKRD